jgi:hypothetical protein
MKMYGEAEVKSHALTLALDGGKQSPSSSSLLFQATKANLDSNSEENHFIPGCPA